MKKNIVLFLALNACSGIAASSDNYLNRFLPEDSLIRKRCNKEANYLFFKGSKCKQCEYIDSVLKDTYTNEQKPGNQNIGERKPEFAFFALFTSPALDAICEILSDQTDDVKMAELEKVSLAICTMVKDREERLKKQKEERKAQEEYA